MVTVALTAGHGQSVTCASWSHSGKLLITSSDDKTANVWSLGTLDPIMTISTTIHNISADSSDKVSSIISNSTVLTLSPSIPLRLYTLPYWSNILFLIFDIRALWRSGVSTRAPECQKLKIMG